MYERFSRSAIQVIEAATQEARSASRRTAGTGNLLLALAEIEASTAQRVLLSLGCEAGAARRLSASISDPDDTEAQGFSPDARKAFEFAVYDSARRGHGYIGTAHILLGLTSLTQAAGAQILIAAGVDIKILETSLEQALLGDAEAGDLGPSKKSEVTHQLSATSGQAEMPGPDEIYALKRENERLRNLLRENGIDPRSS
jgi:ATP-dependent Clp protease ATP-binding subunit ClpA